MRLSIVLAGALFLGVSASAATSNAAEAVPTLSKASGNLVVTCPFKATDGAIAHLTVRYLTASGKEASHQVWAAQGAHRFSIPKAQICKHNKQQLASCYTTRAGRRVDQSGSVDIGTECGKIR